MGKREVHYHGGRRLHAFFQCLVELEGICNDWHHFTGHSLRLNPHILTVHLDRSSALLKGGFVDPVPPLGEALGHSDQTSRDQLTAMQTKIVSNISSQFSPHQRYAREAAS